jgi:hypothetical protein
MAVALIPSSIRRNSLYNGASIMITIRWSTWRRDLLIAALASFITTALLVPIGWAAMRDRQEQAEAARRMAQAAALLAEQNSADADQQRVLAQRNLVEQAADFAGFNDRAEVDVMQVTTAAVSPEVPKGAHLLIDKQATSYAIGDIVIYRVEENNLLGRVVAVEKEAGRLIVGRNGETNRTIPFSDIVGRGVLNTR